jgi:hypothetical protein
MAYFVFQVWRLRRWRTVVNSVAISESSPSHTSDRPNKYKRLGCMREWKRSCYYKYNKLGCLLNYISVAKFSRVSFCDKHLFSIAPPARLFSADILHFISARWSLCAAAKRTNKSHDLNGVMNYSFWFESIVLLFLMNYSKKGHLIHSMYCLEDTSDKDFY